MVAVVIGLVLIVTIAAGIVAMVAAPRLREGEELFTPGSRQTIVRAGQQAKEQSAAAAGTTWHWVSSLRARLARGWAPASRALHEQFDRLEGQAQPPVRHATGPLPILTRTDQGFEPAGPAGGAAAIGRPRPMPDESGPIPIEDDETAAGYAADYDGHNEYDDDGYDGADEHDAAVAEDPAVINLSGPEPEPAPERATRTIGRLSPDVTTRRIR